MTIRLLTVLLLPSLAFGLFCSEQCNAQRLPPGGAPLAPSTSFITNKQGEKELIRYGSRSGNRLEDVQTEWRVDHTMIDSGLSPLTATLIVQDSTGARATAGATLPLAMQRTPKVVDQRVERSGDRERLASILVGFGFSSAALSEQNRRGLESVVDFVRDGAHITVVGYTDRIGNAERNRELAEERAANAAAALQTMLKEQGVKGVTVTASGEGGTTGRFDNNLPEGRVLSRGVGIVVEQSIQEPSQP